MKKIKFLMLAVLLLTATASFAQFTQRSAQESSGSDTKTWGTLWLEWNPSSFRPDKGDSESFTGFSLGYSHSISLSPAIPLFLEPGIGIQYSFKSIKEDEDDDYYDDDDDNPKFRMLSAKIPVNVEYVWQIPGSSIAIIPYTGLNFRFNIFAKEYYYDDDVDLFDKDDMKYNYRSDTWKRFQVGWQIGVKARFGKHFMLGTGYGTDFSEIAKKTKIGTGNISVAYTF